VTPFARYFQLQDPARDDFRLSTNLPEHLRLYVHLDDSLEKLQAALKVQTPLLVVEGDIGTGKSHLLRYVERVELNGEDRLFEPIYVLLSGFGRRSDFLAVHQQIASKLIDKAAAAMQAPGPDRAARVDTLQDISENMRKALRYLGIVGLGTEHEDTSIAKQWLMASSKLTGASLKKANLSCTLFQEGGPNHVVDLYKGISDLYRKTFKRKLLLLLDEGESFSNVVDIDAQADIGSGMRTLFDGENQSIGCFLGLNTPRARGFGVHPMLRSDVQSRVGNRQIRLSSLTSARHVGDFMELLWPKLAKDPGRLPFLLDRAAFDLVTLRLDDFRKSLARDEDQLSATPSPRDLLHVLSDIGQNAVRKDVEPPIRVDLIRRWYALTKN
jgi:hypothetical protein